METPFVFGKIATDVEFTDRQFETQHLLNNFNGLVNTVLISPRRWGKSSLVSKSAGLYCEQSKDHVVVFLDLFHVCFFFFFFCPSYLLPQRILIKSIAFKPI